ncbi:hypothetical protein TBLA_0G01600 [Henningerozyma blattae CBS 6284]|uniref:Rhomboid-type serine protease 2 n=1 Tax=Henningerozyma blattae (strain ATCC 34711 / CBS 6284 / DSM 70876 / NBRC 10599 / NRRL Y-10934 / UCD 77-7) TaxID=1071380 RepID=I2H6V2_HENB6|nr:hypothetical protein TBLA_0G01600 [Tetrapisispora blattae CBS 6284]CCH62104.1 hypothetical protein TBLA_0G01600 [Tetrapisispora blattae CBS 6284]
MNLKRFFSPTGEQPAVLSVGLAIFLLLLFGINQMYPINQKLSMQPESLFTFDIGRLSSYPLGHMSITHIIFNILALIPLLNIFETTHGTLYTGVLLNISAVVCGVMYCVAGRFLYPEVSVLGASGWGFTFFAYFAVKEASVRPRQRLFGTQYSFPTLIGPIVTLALIAIFVPGSSFWGHLFGMIFGYFMGWKENWVSKIAPPSWILIKIEGWLSKPIDLIPSFVTYHKEESMNRDSDYISFVDDSENGLPLHNTEGTVLGTA